jgi:thioredoxin reductase (NADPH)
VVTETLNKTTNEEFDIPATGFFVTGHKPNTDILRTLLILMKQDIS